jgi:hypothetical protein
MANPLLKYLDGQDWTDSIDQCRGLSMKDFADEVLMSPPADDDEVSGEELAPGTPGDPDPKTFHC